MESFELRLENYEIAGSHHLDLPYDSPCKNIHGHNWYISVCLKSRTLAAHGMILDFKHIKDYLKTFDHKDLNSLVPFNPTAENLAKHFGSYVLELAQAEGCESIYFVECRVTEASHNTACWTWEKE